MGMKKTKKAPIDPERIRTIPAEGFSWIDRRFVREGFIKALDRDAVLLYLFLVAVSDAHGISFYSDPSIGKLIKLTSDALARVRTQLINQQLILHQYPLYQVLPLPRQVKPHPREKPSPTSQASGEKLISFREFRKLMGRDRAREEEGSRG